MGKSSPCDEPLSLWFKILGDEESPFEEMSSANWRGYVGTWQIKDNRLYLVDLRGKLKNGAQGSIETFFPGFPDRVFAHWFSGRNWPAEVDGLARTLAQQAAERALLAAPRRRSLSIAQAA